VVHPISPRDGLNTLRGEGLRRELTSGRLFTGARREVLVNNTGLRALQIADVAEVAGKETRPVVIAGDTNLPVLSPVFARNLGGYQDGFVKAGGGFGYTFPASHPWMRIDRILASDALHFTSFEVGCSDRDTSADGSSGSSGSTVSDHDCVVAELQGAR
jgi:endonuclease/exonuclease/phosphatase family metal-dependent hydrolase